MQKRSEKNEHQQQARRQVLQRLEQVAQLQASETVRPARRQL